MFKHINQTMNIKEIAILGSLAIGMFACGNETKTETAATETETKEEKVEEVKAMTFTADAASSVINWRGEAVGGSYFHTGTAALKDGSLTMEGEKVTGGTFTVDMTVLTATDENYSEEHPSDQLIGHLGTADFFDVENNPTATFVVESMEGNVINGKLTVRGKTVDEQVEDVTITNENGELTATGKIVFDRQKHDVSYKSTMKDMVVSDDIALDITLKAKAAM